MLLLISLNIGINPRLTNTASMTNGRAFIKPLLILSTLSFMVTIPHVIEDFQYRVPESFGINPSIAGLLVGIGLAVQVGGIIGIVRGTKWGLIITLFVSAGWFMGAILDHLSDVLSTSPYRHGFLSRSLEALIILDFGVILVLSGLGLKKMTSRSVLRQTKDRN